MAARYGRAVLEYAKQTATAFTTEDVASVLDLTGAQARRALRHFADDGRLVRLGASTWQHPDNIDTGSAREAREDARASAVAAEQIGYTYVDRFVDGALLLRGDNGVFYRAYITEID